VRCVVIILTVIVIIVIIISVTRSRGEIRRRLCFAVTAVEKKPVKERGDKCTRAGASTRE